MEITKEYVQLEGREALRALAAVANYIHNVILGDMSFSVIEDDTYLAYIPGKTIDIKRKPGDRITSGSAAHKCMSEGKRILKEFNKEESPFGIPYIAHSLPVFDASGTVVGCILTAEDVSKQDTIRETSETLSYSTQHISESLQTMNSQMQEIRASGEQLNMVTQNTVEKVASTDQVIEFIEKVAKQTNLLGLNASIEAARLGEAGRGFNVVAAEVRKLAVQSSDSAKQIKSVLEHFQSSIHDVNATSNTLLHIINEQAKVIEEIAAYSQEVSAVSQKMEDISHKLLEYNK